jgi:hypothetical protein
MSQPCIADQMLDAAANLVGKDGVISFGLAHRTVANGRRCESSCENICQLGARLLRQEPAYG